jgi:16S rRNA (cytosine967-C5)-methyltransferase
VPPPTRPPRLLELAAAVLGDWRANGRAPRDAVAALLPRDLDAARRAAVARTVYAVVRGERRLEFALGERALEGLDARARDAALVLAQRVATGETTPAGAAARFRALSTAPLPFDAVLAAGRAIAQVADPRRRFALRHSLPDWLAEALLAGFGAEADALAAALDAEPPRTIRANALRVADRGQLARELEAAGVPTAPTRHSPWGLVVAGEAPLFGLDAWRRGAFEQQDEGSQLAALAVAPPPRGKVFDACAGSGGKALALAAMLQNRGAVLAADVQARRVAALQQRARRAGAHDLRAVAVAEDAWPSAVREFAAAADRILLDVPCSGVGSWRRRPEARWSLQPGDLPSLQRRQAELLDRACGVLQPGARIAYVTCTVFAAENERQVEAALARHPELELVPLKEVLGGAMAAPISDAGGRYLSLRPDRHGTDGFFAAVLRRRRG